MIKNYENGSIRLRCVRSTIRKPAYQRAVLKGLGLTKIGQERTVQASPEILGMVKRVRHLLSIETCE